MEFFCYHRDRHGSVTLRDELLLSDDGAAWLGTAVLLRAPDPDAARAILTPGRYADIEVHNWQFGGRQ